MKIKLLATIEIDVSLCKRFQTGELAREWRAKYPQLFDDDDLRLTISQPINHFYEWAAAIHLYEDKGYYSLVEKYQYKNHKRKHAIM